MNILLLLNRELFYKEKKIIENLLFFKGIHIDTIENKNNSIKYDKIYSNYLEKTIKYKSIIQIIKDILFTKKNLKEKLLFLQNIFKNIKCIIISSGPTSQKIHFQKLKELQNIYIIISVKYVIQNLIDNYIFPDIAFFSNFTNDENFNLMNANKNYNINNILTFGVYKTKLELKAKNLLDINCIHRGLKHSEVYTNIQKNKNFDIIRFDLNKIKNDKLLFNLAHVMLELVIPFSEFSSMNEIYTIGWDGPDKNGNYKNLNCNDLNFNEILKCEKNKQTGYSYNEYIYISYVKQMFENENLKVYKCCKESPIELEC